MSSESGFTNADYQFTFDIMEVIGQLSIFVKELEEQIYLSGADNEQELKKLNDIDFGELAEW